jgi:hypothetical protein
MRGRQQSQLPIRRFAAPLFVATIGQVVQARCRHDRRYRNACCRNQREAFAVLTQPSSDAIGSR